MPLMDNTLPSTVTKNMTDTASANYDSEFHKNVAQLTRLAAAQIRVAVAESGESVEDLSTSFTEIVSQDKLIREKINQLPDEPKTQEIKQQIESLSDQIGTNVQNAVMAFQFYDRLCQRLDHTSECLRNLSEIEDSQLKSSIEEVIKLREEVYNHFTMKEERQLFDAVLNNNDFEHAISDYNIARAQSLVEEDDDDDIELF